MIKTKSSVIKQCHAHVDWIKVQNITLTWLSLSFPHSFFNPIDESADADEHRKRFPATTPKITPANSSSQNPMTILFAD